MVKKNKFYDLSPIVKDGKRYVTAKNPITVVFVGFENGYNIYVEQPNSDLKFVSGLSEKPNGEKITEAVCKEFAEAAATDELVRRINNGEVE